MKGRTALAVAAFSLASACATVNPRDTEVFATVIGSLASEGEIDGFDLSSWLTIDRPAGCDDETLGWLKRLPGVTEGLLSSFCENQSDNSSLTLADRRMLAKAIPRASSQNKPRPRDLEFSAVGYDDRSGLALVFLERQVAAACDVGEYYLLERNGEAWKVVARHLHWIT